MRSHDFVDFEPHGQKNITYKPNAVDVWCHATDSELCTHRTLFPIIFFHLFPQLDILRGIHADLATLANEVNHLLGFQGGLFSIHAAARTAF